MAALGKTFDATEFETEQRDYTELPNGTYKLEVEDSDVVPTSKGDGVILKTTLSVVEPEQFKGRKLFNNYNLENKNPVAQKIGEEQFASLCRAIGVSSVNDSEDLHFHPFMAQIGLGKPQYEKDGRGNVKNDANDNPIIKYPARAEVKKYFFNTDKDGNSIDLPVPSIDAIQPTAAAPVARAQAPANDNQAAASKPAASKPWGKAK